MDTNASAPQSAAKSSSGSKVLLVILGVLLAMFLLVGGCVVACTYYVKTKAEEFGEAAKKNPNLAAIKVASAFIPGLEVVSEDEAAGTVVLRNTKTNEEYTIELARYSEEEIGKVIEAMASGKPLPVGSRGPVSVEGDDASVSAGGETYSSDSRTVDPESYSEARKSALAANVKRLPSFVAPYEDGSVVDATAVQFAGQDVATYAFLTSDNPETVVEFYQKKLTADGFNVVSRSFGTNNDGASASFMAARESDRAAFILGATTQPDGRTKIDIQATGAAAAP
jgi:hypothetical protein